MENYVSHFTDFAGLITIHAYFMTIILIIPAHQNRKVPFMLEMMSNTLYFKIASLYVAAYVAAYIP